MGFSALAQLIPGQIELALSDVRGLPMEQKARDRLGLGFGCVAPAQPGAAPTEAGQRAGIYLWRQTVSAIRLMTAPMHYIGSYSWF
jgi:hypothetical protein